MDWYSGRSASAEDKENNIPVTAIHKLEEEIDGLRAQKKQAGTQVVEDIRLPPLKS